MSFVFTQNEEKAPANYLLGPLQEGIGLAYRVSIEAEIHGPDMHILA